MCLFILHEIISCVYFNHDNKTSRKAKNREKRPTDAIKTKTIHRNRNLYFWFPTKENKKKKLGAKYINNMFNIRNRRFYCIDLFNDRIMNCLFVSIVCNFFLFFHFHDIAWTHTRTHNSCYDKHCYYQYYAILS